MKVNLICLDYGLNWTGIAIATTPLAEPLKTIPTNQILTTIPKLAKDYNIDALIIGISENKMAQATRQFSQKLKKIINLPIYLHDETLSSQESRCLLAQAGARQKKRQSKTDHYAAAAILQDFLDIYPDLDSIAKTAKI
jgi:putative transcription antitermination factor YqgF